MNEFGYELCLSILEYNNKEYEKSFDKLDQIIKSKDIKNIGGSTGIY
jgi:hypothetical protein